MVLIADEKIFADGDGIFVDRSDELLDQTEEYGVALVDIVLGRVETNT